MKRVFNQSRFYRLAFVFFLIANGALAQFRNDRIADGATQPAVTVNPKNPANIVIACGTSQVRYSQDGGETWKESKTPFPATSLGEAVLRSNDEGMVFFIHNNNYSDSVRTAVNLVCQTSMSGGRSWTPAEVITPSAKSKFYPHAFIHPKKGRIGIVWSEFDQLSSEDPGCLSRILYSQSSDGKKWSEPDVLSQESGDCSENSNALYAPSVAMDDEHKIFATWAMKENVVMDRSYDGGKNWLSSDMNALRIAGLRQYGIPGIGNVSRRPFMTTDNSHSVYKGSLYLVWSDQRNGANDTDIFFSGSVRRGDTWTAPLRINKDEKGKHQFMPAITVDQTSGVIYIVYYDRRGYSDNQTDVYLAWSTNGGEKFTEVKISENPFTPTEGKVFTDYISISAEKGVIVPVWVRAEDGKTSVWSTTIHQDKIIKPEEMPRQLAVQRSGSRVPQRPVQQKRRIN